MDRFRHRRLAAALGASVLLATTSLTAGCGGGGGGGGDGGGSTLSILAATLPIAQPDAFYSQELLAQGGTPPYVFRVSVASQLPPGMTLSSNGVFAGVPTQTGTTAFRVEVRDSAEFPAFATRLFSLQVGGLGLNVQGTLAGKAWTGRSYPLSTSSTPPSAVTIELADSESGGTLREVDPLHGTATYDAGPVAGTDTFVLRRASGTFTVVTLDVRPNPVAHMVARFGDTDVWHVAFEGREDPLHVFSSDFHAALAKLGLRDPASTAPYATLPDDLASLCVRVETLRRLNEAFGNTRSGAPGPAGFAISFPFAEPLSPLVPAPGQALPAMPGAWNRIRIADGNTPTSWGSSLPDDPQNSHVENLETTGAGPLGVFVDLVATLHDERFANPLESAPVGAADVLALESVLYEEPAPPGARAAAVRAVVHGFARSLAFGVAHEVGHCLGLSHDLEPFSIMNPLVMPPTDVPPFAFSAADADALREALPGPGR